MTSAERRPSPAAVAGAPCRETWRLACSDLARAYGRTVPTSRLGQIRLVAGTIPAVKALAVLGVRLAHGVHHRSPAIASLIKQVTHVLTGADIGFEARIGAGFRLPHPTGVVIAHGAEIGEDCTIHQGVTLGSTPEGSPTLGNRVNVAPGARILGAVSVGDGCHIAANSVVTRTFEGTGLVIAGVPARVLRQRSAAELDRA